MTISKKTNVLIVDDDKSIRELLSEGLSELGYHCTEAHDSKDALKKFAKKIFEIVLLDIGLPGISGMEVLREMQPYRNRTGVIMITGSNDIDTAVQAMKLGAFNYIVKPFTISRVDEAITDTLGDLLINTHNNEMEAIAFGVEQRLDLVSHHSELVMSNTAETARLIGISDGDINNWVDNRVKYAQSKKKPLEIAMGKLRRSPLT